MFNGYNELAALPAEAYLDWEQFKTWFDDRPNNIKKGYPAKQYAKGLKVGKESDYIYLTIKGVWGSVSGNGTSTWGSYEGIGYHACTKELLHGFLDSGCPIHVARRNLDGTITTTIINDLTPAWYDEKQEAEIAAGMRAAGIEDQI